MGFQGGNCRPAVPTGLQFLFRHHRHSMRRHGTQEAEGCPQATSWKTTWGAPKAKQAEEAAIEAEIFGEEEEEDAIVEPEGQTKQEEKPAAGQASTGAKPHPRPEGKGVVRPSKIRKVESAPWQEWFEAVDNEGQGDCAYISAARGLNANASTKKSASESDFKPKGTLQASLRLLTSAELSNHKAKYKVDNDYCKKVAAAGFEMDSVQMRAMATATKTNFIVSAQDASSKAWTLYASADNLRKKQPKEVWLVVSNRH